MLATAFRLGSELKDRNWDYIINAGIAGAVDYTLKVGEVVQVVQEQLYDMGAEDHGNFRDIFELGLCGEDEFPFEGGRLINSTNPVNLNFPELKKVNGITVNTVHGNNESVIELHRRNPEASIESMEGAAFFYAAIQSGIPFIQLRAISNLVEARNRENWNIGLAVSNLNDVLIRTLL